MSQRALAFPGCSAAYIARIESGDRRPSLQVVRELARRLGVDEDYLAWGRGRRREDELVEAEVALRLGDAELAERLYRVALTRESSSAERGRALAGLGQLAWQRDDPVGAIGYLEEALGLLGDRFVEHPELGDTLGRAYTTVPDMARSIEIFERYLTALKERQDFFGTVRFSVLLANALMDDGELTRAQGLLESALADAEGAGDPFTLARVYWSQSRLYEHRGEYDAAARYARGALELLEATDHTEYLGRAHQLLAYIEAERGNAEEALELARRSRELMGDAASEFELVRTTMTEARALAQLGERERAASLAMEAAGLLPGLHPVNAGRNYALLAGILEEIGDRGRSLELYELAIELLEPHWNPFLPETCARYAELLESEGRRDEAFEVLRGAVRRQAEWSRQRDVPA
jgi:tetratricopeptide (TPR) repeat protein